MRVVALGGNGGMGRRACAVLAACPAVTELVVADRSAAEARAYAETLGPHVLGVGVDATDPATLAAAFADAGLVMNTVGPYFRFGVPILTAAIDTGCHYVDICDDWEPTLEMLGLHGRARAAGVTAVIGMGATPGVSNLLALLAAGELDIVDELLTGWNIEDAQPEDRADRGTRRGPVNAALVHGVQQATGTIRVVRDRQPVDERPLRRVDIVYPGVGRRATWTFGHPEPLTLPHTIDVATSANVMFGSRAFITGIRTLRWAVDRRLLSVDRAARLVQVAEDRLPTPEPDALLDPTKLPPLFAWASGRHAGRPAAVGAALARFPGITMADNTGVPLAVVVDLIARGEISRPGVFAPDAVVPPAAFFEALARHCPGDPEAADMTVITRSWDTDATSAYRSALAGALAATLAATTQ